MVDTINNGQPTLAEKGIVPLTAKSARGVNNFPIQDKYIWPWSHPALLFGFVVSLKFFYLNKKYMLLIFLIITDYYSWYIGNFIGF